MAAQTINGSTYEIRERPSRHNGQPVTAYDLYVNGLPTGYTTMYREDIDEYIALLTEDARYNAAQLGQEDEP